MNAQGDEFELTGPDYQAWGNFTDNGFNVRAGSIARLATSASSQFIRNRQHRLLSEGVVEAIGNQLRFIRDYSFASPSGAATAVSGRSSNGWISWRCHDGRTLSEVRRVSRGNRTQLLDERQKKLIVDRQRKLMDEGKLPSAERLEQEHTLFREKFGPSVLSSLDGEALLTLMHDLGNRDSLVYWLEFKSDEEFDTRRLGSIAGGSALKFRIFRRKDTGRWQKQGDSGNRIVDISLDEAIEIARSHRDQLIKGLGLLENLPADATDDDYAELQDQMDEVAPDVSRLAWGHKYFSLFYPDKLDDYHNPALQRFVLLKLLQLPPEGDGRYVCAGRFISAARETGLLMHHLTTTLNSLFGHQHRYWRIGTTLTETGESLWPRMRDRGCVAIGWSELGDLSWYDGKAESQEKLRTQMEKAYPTERGAVGRAISQVSQFIINISEGDVVVAAEGMKVLGVGRVVGDYEFNDEFEFAHRRPVEWLSTESWKLPDAKEGLLSTVRQLRKSTENLLTIEQRMQSADSPSVSVQESDAVPIRPVRLHGIPGRIQSVLERKGQVVLYGPPGTGKTYWAEKTAYDLAAISAFGKLFEQLSDAERMLVTGNDDQPGLVRLCCFHPAYGYEDFLEGYRPRTVAGQVSFELRDGVFKRLCRDASESPKRNFYLIVDEINRGDIPRIFGELLTTLEKDKRGKRIILPVSQEVFSVPRNVFLIGTMNTADRSISLLDAALRRRFGFVELMPDGSVLKEAMVGGIALRGWLEALNARIRDHVGRDSRNLQIGHSYLMHGTAPVKDLAMLKRAIRDDIIPLLEEYCYEDYGTLGNILGDQLVDVSSARIRHELFDDGQEDALVQSLLAPFADLAISSGGIVAGEVPLDDEDGEDEGAEDEDADGAEESP